MQEELELEILKYFSKLIDLLSNKNSKKEYIEMPLILNFSKFNIHHGFTPTLK